VIPAGRQQQIGIAGKACLAIGFRKLECTASIPFLAKKEARLRRLAV